MSIYQARFNRYLEDRGLKKPSSSEGLGVPRRRRNRRTGIARRHQPGVARKARQPDLRHQLQPAASRRSGPRQRPDHPGTRSHLPRRRLERHQGDLGQRLGSAAGGRPRRSARQADGRSRRRAVPEVRGRRRRLHARALLRHRSAAARHGQAPVGRTAEEAPPRRSRSGQGLQRLQDGGRDHRAADGDPGAHDQGLRSRRGRRRQEHHAPAEEDERVGSARVPHALRDSDLGRRDRRCAVLSAGRRQHRAAVPARAPQGARRLRADTHRSVSSRSTPRSSRSSRSSTRAPKGARPRRRWCSCGSCRSCCATRKSAS